jgi:mRNA-degrading endonuclease RelE of RelBE toxin-antitoxin system
MSYKVDTILLFDKQAKRLNKKYPSLKNDLVELIEKLAEEPEQGTPLGNNFYKIRLKIKSKGKGKSGGARVITYIKVIATTVYLTAIYDKGEQSTLSDIELKIIFKTIP